jgi:ribonuclease P protein component
LKRAEFRRVYDEGRRFGNSLFTVFARRQDAAKECGPRAGFTVPRALGKSVDRNRMRRRLREAVRLCLAGVNGPVDMVFHPRRQVLEVPFEELRRKVEQVVAQCGTL